MEQLWFDYRPPFRARPPCPSALPEFRGQCAELLLDWGGVNFEVHHRRHRDGDNWRTESPILGYWPGVSGNGSLGISSERSFFGASSSLLGAIEHGFGLSFR
jgi:hypothetical protein